ncbi:hypothetical protein G6M89_03090 [Natronolimnobius sp. AArcel1]|uniref:hypothetical protein n=1 Tax=Natronolimnobius sp. AArcel1 TaxID=1679093 RepID=UPI0013EAB1C5|nr:hypothetical protein [Natronolimnobius sp. AArcel1]NGM68008.1 hypothetical protein [Natronolimnobius sp. AArcel1]
MDEFDNMAAVPGLRNIRVSQAWMNIETASHSPPEAATRRVTEADEAGHTDTTPADRLPISGLSRRQQSITTLDPSRLMSGFVLRILNRHQQAELTYRRFHYGRRDEPLPEESITESADSIPGRPPLSYLASVTDDDRATPPADLTPQSTRPAVRELAVNSRVPAVSVRRSVHRIQSNSNSADVPESPPESRSQGAAKSPESLFTDGSRPSLSLASTTDAAASAAGKKPDTHAPQVSDSAVDEPTRDDPIRSSVPTTVETTERNERTDVPSSVGPQSDSSLGVLPRTNEGSQTESTTWRRAPGEGPDAPRAVVREDNDDGKPAATNDAMDTTRDTISAGTTANAAAAVRTRSEKHRKRVTARLSQNSHVEAMETMTAASLERARDKMTLATRTDESAQSVASTPNGPTDRPSPMTDPQPRSVHQQQAVVPDDGSETVQQSGQSPKPMPPDSSSVLSESAGSLERAARRSSGGEGSQSTSQTTGRDRSEHPGTDTGPAEGEKATGKQSVGSTAREPSTRDRVLRRTAGNARQRPSSTASVDFGSERAPKLGPQTAEGVRAASADTPLVESVETSATGSAQILTTEATQTAATEPAQPTTTELAQAAPTESAAPWTKTRLGRAIGTLNASRVRTGSLVAGSVPAVTLEGHSVRRSSTPDSERIGTTNGADTDADTGSAAPLEVADQPSPVTETNAQPSGTSIPSSGERPASTRSGSQSDALSTSVVQPSSSTTEYGGQSGQPVSQVAEGGQSDAHRSSTRTKTQQNRPARNRQESNSVSVMHARGPALDPKTAGEDGNPLSRPVSAANTPSLDPQSERRADSPPRLTSPNETRRVRPPVRLQSVARVANALAPAGEGPPRAETDVDNRHQRPSRRELSRRPETTSTTTLSSDQRVDHRSEPESATAVESSGQTGGPETSVFVSTAAFSRPELRPDTHRADSEQARPSPQVRTRADRGQRSQTAADAPPHVSESVRNPSSRPSRLSARDDGFDSSPASHGDGRGQESGTGGLTGESVRRSRSLTIHRRSKTAITTGTHPTALEPRASQRQPGHAGATTQGPSAQQSPPASKPTARANATQPSLECSSGSAAVLEKTGESSPNGGNSGHLSAAVDTQPGATPGAESPIGGVEEQSAENQSVGASVAARDERSPTDVSTPPMTASGSMSESRPKTPTATDVDSAETTVRSETGSETSPDFARIHAVGPTVNRLSAAVQGRTTIPTVYNRGRERVPSVAKQSARGRATSVLARRPPEPPTDEAQSRQTSNARTRVGEHPQSATEPTRSTADTDRLTASSKTDTAGSRLHSVARNTPSNEDTGREMIKYKTYENKGKESQSEKNSMKSISRQATLVYRDTSSPRSTEDAAGRGGAPNAAGADRHSGLTGRPAANTARPQGATAPLESRRETATDSMAGRGQTAGSAASRASTEKHRRKHSSRADRGRPRTDVSATARPADTGPSAARGQGSVGPGSGSRIGVDDRSPDSSLPPEQGGRQPRHTEGMGDHDQSNRHGHNRTADRDQRPAVDLPWGEESVQFDADVDRIVDRLYRKLERKQRIERERRGL